MRRSDVLVIDQNTDAIAFLGQHYAIDTDLGLEAEGLRYFNISLHDPETPPCILEFALITLLSKSITAVSSLYEMVRILRPRHVILIGSSTGVSTGIHPGDVVVSDRVVSYTSTKSLDQGTYWLTEPYVCSPAIRDAARHAILNDESLRPLGTRAKFGDVCAFSNVVADQGEPFRLIKREYEGILSTDNSTWTGEFCGLLARRDTPNFVLFHSVADQFDDRLQSDATKRRANEDVWRLVISTVRAIRSKASSEPPADLASDEPAVTVTVAGEGDRERIQEAVVQVTGNANVIMLGS
jgi:Phosphorylase superfamily